MFSWFKKKPDTETSPGGSLSSSESIQTGKNSFGESLKKSRKMAHVCPHFNDPNLHRLNQRFPSFDENPDIMSPDLFFFPYTEQKIRAVASAGGRFVYYTTAETATTKR